MKKIALCLYGQPRFINNPNIKKSFDKFIFDRYDVDPYLHFWYNDEINFLKGSDWHDTPTKFYEGGNFQIIENTMEIIDSVYRPFRKSFEKPRDFSTLLNDQELTLLENKPVNHEGKNYFSLRNVDSLLSHLYSIEESLNLVDLNREYDFLILTRYDSIILEFPNLEKLERGYVYATNKFGHNGKTYNFTDNIFVIDINLINGLKCFSNISNILNRIPMWIAEHVKKENIIYNFGEDSIKYIDLLVGVARNIHDTIGQANQ